MCMSDRKRKTHSSFTVQCAALENQFYPKYPIQKLNRETTCLHLCRFYTVPCKSKANFEIQIKPQQQHGFHSTLFRYADERCSVSGVTRRVKIECIAIQKCDEPKMIFFYLEQLLPCVFSTSPHRVSIALAVYQTPIRIDSFFIDPTRSRLMDSQCIPSETNSVGN